ncbi:MAG: DUF6232 family protein [bacterium]
MTTLDEIVYEHGTVRVTPRELRVGEVRYPIQSIQSMGVFGVRRLTGEQALWVALLVVFLLCFAGAGIWCIAALLLLFFVGAPQFSSQAYVLTLEIGGERLDVLRRPSRRELDDVATAVNKARSLAGRLTQEALDFPSPGDSPAPAMME